MAKPLGPRGTSGAISWMMRSAWLASHASPVRAASRISAIAAVELAEGVALSKMSFWRTISRSPSSGVVNRPPWSTSQKWSSNVSAVAVASPIHDASPVASARRTTRRPAPRGRRRGRRGALSARRCHARPMPPTGLGAQLNKQEPSASAAASIHDGSPCKAPASASSTIIRAFHSVSTLSSRLGRGRAVRASNSAWRAISISAGRCQPPGHSPMRLGIDRRTPSSAKFPPAVMS